MNKKELKTFYIRQFETAQTFKNWVEKTIEDYNNPRTDYCFTVAEYELLRLHKNFGSCDPNILVEILYPRQ